ncbi:hypothetical protein AAHE18_14G123100 [Arachis hypogaea]
MLYFSTVLYYTMLTTSFCKCGTLNALKKLLLMCLIQNIHYALGGCHSSPERFTTARIDSCRPEIIPIPSLLTTCLRKLLRKKCHTSAVSLPHQGKSNRHNVLVTILCNNNQKCTFVFSVKMCTVNLNQRLAMLECANAWVETSKYAMKYLDIVCLLTLVVQGSCFYLDN